MSEGTLSISHYKGYSRYINIIIGIGDLININLSWFVAFQIISNDQIIFTKPEFINSVLIFNISWLLLIAVYLPYKTFRKLMVMPLLRRVVLVMILHLLVIVGYISFVNLGLSFQLLGLWFAISLSLALLFRILFINALSIYRKKGYNYRNIVIYGYTASSRMFHDVVIDNPNYGYRFLGYFDNNHEDHNITGNLLHLKNIIIEEGVDEVFIAVPYIDKIKLNELIEYCDYHFVKVKLISDLSGLSERRIDLELYEHVPVLNVNPIPLDQMTNKVVKRLFDIIFSILVIVSVLSWLFPLVSILIYISSGQPILFIQKRSGKRNRNFNCYKFRTMRVNQVADSKQSTKTDQRVTKLGRILRKTSIDELPQFFNTLIGDMSVVGPRPHMLQHTVDFSQKVDRYMMRHNVKPGITGLAQIKGFRGEISNLSELKGRVDLDKFYIEHWSLGFDIKIAFHTIINVLKGQKKAY